MSTSAHSAGPARSPDERIGLSGVGAALPPKAAGLEELASTGRLVSEPRRLAAMGFDRAYVAEGGDAFPLAVRAARDALVDAALAPKDIDLLIWAAGLPQNHLTGDTAGFADARDRAGLLKGFRYAGGALQAELDLGNAQLLAVAQQGCASMFAAVRAARAMLIAEPGLRHVLCVGADALPPAAPREVLFNVISDAAAAAVVSRGAARDRWLGFRQVSHGRLGDPLTQEPEIVAAYFPTARAVIRELLDECRLRPADVDAVIPTGVQPESWDILLRLTGIPSDRLRLPAEGFGHTISADNLLILRGLRRTGSLPRGSRLLLFTYGFGSTWCAMLLEH